MATAQEPNLVGIGLYSVSEAHQLTGVPADSIRRWLLGYTYRHGDDVVESRPVWQAQIPPIDNTLGLGFLDLMEIRFVHAFRKHGVTWRVIRAAAARARTLYQKDHPFSTQRFRTDGRRIFWETLEESGETKLLDLVHDQYAFHQIIASTLYAGLEFSPQDEVTRWFPMWPKRQVVLDPQRAFGRPILDAAGVPTEVLARAVEVEGSVQRVARWYAVPERAVRAAVEFQEKIAA
jgi:uncharacterized protein (DUF433 family)